MAENNAIEWTHPAPVDRPHPDQRWLVISAMPLRGTRAEPGVPQVDVQVWRDALDLRRALARPLNAFPLAGSFGQNQYSDFSQRNQRQHNSVQGVRVDLVENAPDGFKCGLVGRHFRRYFAPH